MVALPYKREVYRGESFYSRIAPARMQACPLQTAPSPVLATACRSQPVAVVSPAVHTPSSTAWCTLQNSREMVSSLLSMQVDRGGGGHAHPAACCSRLLRWRLTPLTGHV